MKREVFLGCAMLLGCGSAQVISSPTGTVTDEENTATARDDAEQPGADTEEARALTDGPRTTVRRLLDGRFEITLPTEIALAPSQAWFSSENLRAYYDSYELEVQQCRLTFAMRSHGLLRPRDVPVGEGESRLFAPSEGASPHLEIVTTRARPFAVLGLMYAAVGAVAFESDGTATDFFLWPELSRGEESVVPEGDDWDSDDWYAAQRQDPRLARCYGVAERLLSEALPTLAARRAFAPVQTRLYFGYDENIDESIAYEGAVPDGWIITNEPAYDASFDDLHRRQLWSWVPPVPSPRARVWMYAGLWPDDEPLPPMGPRREDLFDHDLRFDRGQGEDGSCAWAENRDLGLTHTVCLRGTRAEQNELVAILRTFARVRSGDADLAAAASDARQTCVTHIHDADGQTNVRARASSRSEVVGTMANGAAIVPVEQRGPWLRITTPHAGWVFRDNVERRCE